MAWLAAAAPYIQAAAAAAAVAGTAYSVNEQRQARGDQKRASAEQAAMAQQRQAAEARQQYREERIRRAQILQQSENTGVSESSGMLGAMGSLSTQLSSNQGYNIGQIQKANNISIFQQNAEDALGRARTGEAVGGAVSNIFGATAKLGYAWKEINNGKP